MRSYKEVCKMAKKITSIDSDMDTRVRSMANRTWDTIGGDVLTNLAEYEQKNSIKRKEVIEVVSDADYMLTHGSDEEAYAYFLYLTEKQPKHRDKVMKAAFPFATYGW